MPVLSTRTAIFSPRWTDLPSVNRSADGLLRRHFPEEYPVPVLAIEDDDDTVTVTDGDATGAGHDEL